MCMCAEYSVRSCCMANIVLNKIQFFALIVVDGAVMLLLLCSNYILHTNAMLEGFIA